MFIWKSATPLNNLPTGLHFQLDQHCAHRYPLHGWYVVPPSWPRYYIVLYLTAFTGRSFIWICTDSLYFKFHFPRTFVIHTRRFDEFCHNAYSWQSNLHVLSIYLHPLMRLKHINSFYFLVCNILWHLKMCWKLTLLRWFLILRRRRSQSDDISTISSCVLFPFAIHLHPLRRNPMKFSSFSS